MRVFRVVSAVASARPPTPQLVRAFACRDVSSSSIRANHEGASSPNAVAPSVGTTYSTQRTFTKEDVTAFAALTGDPNPIHVDGRAASRAGFEAPVVHGMLCANLFGAVIGTLFPGAVYATQSLAFRNPVLVGQAVTAEVTLTRLTGTRAQFDTRVVFRKGEGEGDAADAKTVTAVDGVALALLPKR